MINMKAQATVTSTSSFASRRTRPTFGLIAAQVGSLDKRTSMQQDVNILL